MSTEESWDTVIQPDSGWIDVNIKELWQYRDLVWLFVKRDFVTLYKQTILGPLWYIIQPLVTTVIFTIIFGRIAKISTDQLPPFLFYMSGTTVWGFFSSCLMKTSNTFVANAGIFSKVFFPRLTAPIASVIIGFLQFAIQFAVFMGFYLYFFLKGAPIAPTAWIAASPVLFLQMGLLGMGTGILVSSLTTKYKDMQVAMGFLVQLWMYATPIVYPLTQVPERFRLVYALNPMAAVVESFRYAFLGTGTVRPEYIAVSWTVTLVILLVGTLLFSRIEKTFMDTV